MALYLFKHKDKFTFTFTDMFPGGGWEFPLHHRVQKDSGTHPASYRMGTRGSFLEVKRLQCEADHSPPSSAELYLHSPNAPSWRGA